MIYRVLVAVDGTTASDRALEIACALADNYEAALGLLTVTRPGEISDAEIAAAQIEGVVSPGSNFSSMLDTYSVSSVQEEANRAAKASRLAAVLAEGIVAKAKAFSSDKPFKAVKALVSSGDPADAILECAAENAADIIVMGHDQQGRVEALFRGSVAEEVQRKATCPVLIYCQPRI